MWCFTDAEQSRYGTAPSFSPLPPFLPPSLSLSLCFPTPQTHPALSLIPRCGVPQVCVSSRWQGARRCPGILAPPRAQPTTRRGRGATRRRATIGGASVSSRSSEPTGPSSGSEGRVSRRVFLAYFGRRGLCRGPGHRSDRGAGSELGGARVSRAVAVATSV